MLDPRLDPTCNRVSCDVVLRRDNSPAVASLDLLIDPVVPSARFSRAIPSHLDPVRVSSRLPIPLHRLGGEDKVSLIVVCKRVAFHSGSARSTVGEAIRCG